MLKITPVLDNFMSHEEKREVFGRVEAVIIRHRAERNNAPVTQDGFCDLIAAVQAISAEFYARRR